FGFVKIGEHALLQAIPESQYPELVRTLRKTDFSHPKKISGRVAVLTRAWGHCYFHWLSDVLSRLFLLRKHNIEYDWLYVRCDKPFMKQTLTLLGVDLNRVIQPGGEYVCIQA